VYHFRGQKIFGGAKWLVEEYKTQSLQILSEHVRCAPAPRYNFPHPHFYFILFCAPGSHFTHPHLFHLSFPHPRSRRTVPNSAVWLVGKSSLILDKFRIVGYFFRPYINGFVPFSLHFDSILSPKYFMWKVLKRSFNPSVRTNFRRNVTY
jgi:hypothetical protein